MMVNKLLELCWNLMELFAINKCKLTKKVTCNFLDRNCHKTFVQSRIFNAFFLVCGILTEIYVSSD